MEFLSFVLLIAFIFGHCHEGSHLYSMYTYICTNVTPPKYTVISLALCSDSMSKLKWASCSLASRLPSNHCPAKQMASELAVRLALYAHALIWH